MTLHPTHHLLTMTLKMLLLYLQVYVTLLVTPECVRVEERLDVEGTHQPHSQVYLVHVSSNGSMRG